MIISIPVAITPSASRGERGDGAAGVPGVGCGGGAEVVADVAVVAVVDMGISCLREGSSDAQDRSR
ncbi:hypothetical protein GCM10010349_48410 [Streptomyces flavofungini]|nr:hypothetical protein GCM10010349_48410 [Streptomyces flavofungini]